MNINANIDRIINNSIDINADIIAKSLNQVEIILNHGHSNQAFKRVTHARSRQSNYQTWVHSWLDLGPILTGFSLLTLIDPAYFGPFKTWGGQIYTQAFSSFPEILDGMTRSNRVEDQIRNIVLDGLPNFIIELELSELSSHIIREAGILSPQNLK